MHSNRPPKLLTAAEAAEILGVARVTIMRMIEDGYLKYAHKLPGLRGPYLFDPNEVERVKTEREAAA